MSNDYKRKSTAELEEEWMRKRDEVAGKKPSGRTRGDMDTLLALRREIDRRRGERNPTVEFNFESYVKD